MAYTSIYDKILRNPYKITWLDLFSDSLKKHSRQDMEYAMIAGTSMDSATESNICLLYTSKLRAVPLGFVFCSDGGAGVYREGRAGEGRTGAL